MLSERNKWLHPPAILRTSSMLSELNKLLHPPALPQLKRAQQIILLRIALLVACCASLMLGTINLLHEAVELAGLLFATAGFCLVGLLGKQ
jgi:hypothetical protein